MPGKALGWGVGNRSLLESVWNLEIGLLPSQPDFESSFF